MTTREIDAMIAKWLQHRTMQFLVLIAKRNGVDHISNEDYMRLAKTVLWLEEHSEKSCGA